LGHDAAPFAMDVSLRGDDVRTQNPPPVGRGALLDDRGGGLVAGRLDTEHQHQVVAAGARPTSAASDSTYGGRAMPRSVMMPAIRGCGVTSKAGLRIFAPSG